MDFHSSLFDPLLCIKYEANAGIIVLVILVVAEHDFSQITIPPNLNIKYWKHSHTVPGRPRNLAASIFTFKCSLHEANLTYRLINFVVIHNRMSCLQRKSPNAYVKIEARFIHADFLIVLLQFNCLDMVAVEDRQVGVYSFPLFSSDCL